MEALLEGPLTEVGLGLLLAWGIVRAMPWIDRHLPGERPGRDRPQPVRKPVQIETTHDGVVSLADVVAHLTAMGSTVADEFLTEDDRQHLLQERSGTLAPSAEGGVLLVPDDVELLRVPSGDSAVVPMVVRGRGRDLGKVRHVPLQEFPPGPPPRGPRSAMQTELDRLADGVRRRAVSLVPRAGVLEYGTAKPRTPFLRDDHAARLADVAESRRKLAAAIPQIAEAVAQLTGDYARHVRGGLHRWNQGADPSPSLEAADTVRRGGHHAPPLAVSLRDALAADWEARGLQATIAAAAARPSRPSPTRATWH